VCQSGSKNLGLKIKEKFLFSKDANSTYHLVKTTNVSVSVTFNAGDQFKLDCVIQSLDNDMVPEVEWHHANSSIIGTNDKQNDFTEISRKSYTRSLYLNYVQRNMIGKYVCVRKSEDAAQLELDLDVKCMYESKPNLAVRFYFFNFCF
jgi:hypothetical protein